MKTVYRSTAATFGSINLLCLLLFLYLLIFGNGYCHAETSLKYVTNSFIKITTSERKIIYIDPYSTYQAEPADIILITHSDSDHNQPTKVAQKSTCQIIRGWEAVADGIYRSYTIGNIKITSVPSYDGQWHLKTKCSGFVIEFDGIKIYHAGDTNRIPEMKDLASQNIKVALVPIYIGGEEMNMAVQDINPKIMIPIHADYPKFIYDDALVATFTSSKKLALLPGQKFDLINEKLMVAGKVKRVPQDYNTIQSAMNASVNGDTVIVSEGIYYENINYKGKGIVVTSKFYSTQDWATVQKTIIDGSKCANKDTASTVMFLNKEDSTAVLDGFTITGGTGTKYLFPNGTGSSKFQEGGGIVLHYSSAVIKNNIIINNITKPLAGVTDGGGGGIATMYGNPTIINNLVVSNIAGYAGGIVLNWSGGKVRNNIIYHNSLSSAAYGNGGIMIWQAPKNSAWVENNTIIGNTSLKNAGGISISLASSDAIPVVRNNIVWGNRQATGLQVLLPQNIFYNNIEDYSDATNISVDPKFIEGSFLLSDNSPCIDAGDPTAKYNDLTDPANSTKAISPSKGGLRNDIGAFGGTFAKVLPSLNIADIYTPSSSINPFGSVDKEGSFKIFLLNISSGKLIIDSVCALNKNIFSIPASCRGKMMDIFGKDTLTVSFKPKTGGTLKDTVKIYFKAAGKSGIMRIPLSANITGIESHSSLPVEYKLYQNYPNPFNPSTQIKFCIAKKEHVLLKTLDILGREVETLLNDEMEAGAHSVSWFPPKKLASGVYLINLVAGNYTATSKVLFMK